MRLADSPDDDREDLQMTAEQLLGLVILLGMAVAVAWIVFWLIPDAASDRMIFRLAEVRSQLLELVEAEPRAGRHPDVERLRAHLEKILRIGEPVGLSVILPTAIWVRRHPKRQAARRVREQGTFSFQGLTDSQARVLGVLERRMVREVFRGTFLASRLWFLLFPLWLLVKASLREAVQPLACEDDTETRADLVVMESIDWLHPPKGREPLPA